MGVTINRCGITLNKGGIKINDLSVVPISYRILVDLGGGLSSVPSKTPISNPDANGNYWNKFVGTGTYSGTGPIVNGFYNGLELQNIFDTNNNNLNITMTLVQTPNTSLLVGGNTPGLNGNGTTVGVGDYVGQATRDSMFTNFGDADGVLSFSGLSSDKEYSFKFWGSRLTGGATDSRIIEIKKSTDAWASALSYNGSNNSGYTQSAVFSGITGSDSITFNMRSQAGSTFGYIGVIDIDVT